VVDRREACHLSRRRCTRTSAGSRTTGRADVPGAPPGRRQADYVIPAEQLRAWRFLRARRGSRKDSTVPYAKQLLRPHVPHSRSIVIPFVTSSHHSVTLGYPIDRDYPLAEAHTSSSGIALVL